MSLLGVSTLTDTGRALVEGGVTVDLDLTLVVQLGFFLVLLFVLKPTLFDPMMRLFEEREKRIEGTRHEATKEDERSAKALAEVAATLEQGRAAIAVETRAARQELEGEVRVLGRETASRALGREVTS